MALAGRIEILPERSAAARRDARLRIDDDLPHQPQVDDETPVADAVTRDAVAASAHGNRELRLAREPDSRSDVGDIEWPDDQLRPAGEHTVERGPRKLVAAV